MRYTSVTPRAWQAASRSVLYAPNRVGGATTAISATPAASAGNADADPAQGNIAHSQLDSQGGLDPDVSVQDRPLVRQDVRADVFQGLQIAGIGRLMSAFQLSSGDPYSARLERDPVEPAGVIEHGRQPPRGDVGADSFHHLDGSQRLTEGSDRAGASLRTDHIAPGAELAPELGDRREGVVTGTVNPADAEGQRRSRATRTGHCGRP